MKKKILSIACVLASAITFAQNPTDGLVAHYPFNGNANDESTNSNNGTVNGAMLTTDRFGNANSAYSFDGLSSNITGTAIDLSSGSQITISAWVKSISLTATQHSHIFRQDNGTSNPDILLAFQNNGTILSFGLKTSSYSELDIQINASNFTNGWHHILALYNGANRKVYVDNVLVGTDTVTGTLESSASIFAIGSASASQGEYLDGSIDDISIYAKALSDVEIQALYNENTCTNTVTVYDTVTTNVTVYDTVRTHINSGSKVDGLVAHYPFNGNANDASGNEENGIVSGATLTADRFGNSNRAYRFDGVDDYINMPSGDSSSLNITGDLSMSFWLKTAQVDNGTLLSFGDNYNGTGGYITSIGSYTLADSVISVYSGTGVAGWKAGKKLISDDVWHFITNVISSDTLSVYVDGVLDTLYTSVSSPSSWDGTRAIGSYHNSSKATDGFYKGSIDDIRIYNKAIIQEEVASLYNEGACYKTVYDTVTTTNNVTVQDTLNIYLSELITSINDASQAATTVKVYPNPTENEVTVSIDNYTNLSGVSIKVLDALGTVVHQQLITGSTQSIDVSSWTAGVYFLHVINGSKTVDIRKIVVNN